MQSVYHISGTLHALSHFEKTRTFIILILTFERDIELPIGPMIITEVSQVGQTRSQTRWPLSPKSRLFRLWYTTFGGRMVVLVVEAAKVVGSTHCSSGLTFPLH